MQYSGMMLMAFPPLVMLPCTRSEGRSCCLSNPMAECARTSASRVLAPSQGDAAAWAGFPRYVITQVAIAAEEKRATLSVPGCNMRLAVAFLKAPPSSRKYFPPPPNISVSKQR